MVINMADGYTEQQLQHVIDRVKECGFQPHVTRGTERAIVAAVGSGGSRAALEALQAAPGVDSVVPIAHPFKLVSRQTRGERTRVTVGNVVIGGDEAVVMAGPCSVESREQLFSTARAVKAAGASILRGGAYKPRTSPYDFQGLGTEALKLLSQVREELDMPVVTEVMSTNDIGLISDHADMLQVGARNMQNYDLLRQLAKCSKPILLKRGPSATVKEWLLAAEYLLAGGNENVVLCERGIKSFETEMTRNTLDLAAVALARELTHLPVVADPSHGTGRRDLIAPASRAALAIGADGLIIEVHPCPERALSDGAQSLNLDEFARLMKGLSAPIRSVGTGIDRPRSNQYSDARARYQTLVQRKYSSGLSASEEDELLKLGDILDEFDKPYYEAAIDRLSSLNKKR
ncbi:MAG: 3-deoxy-7-phosphoheptulonate synthase [Acidobacteriia bacterium]|nr:3-deoxy-7-phosphoheptulonate synthase [Terriglobia bacterium]